jgi:hypothetical protein
LNQSWLPTVTRLLDWLTSAMANKAPMSRAARSITWAAHGQRMQHRAHVWQFDSIGAAELDRGTRPRVVSSALRAPITAISLDYLRARSGLDVEGRRVEPPVRVRNRKGRKDERHRHVVAAGTKAQRRMRGSFGNPRRRPSHSTAGRTAALTQRNAQRRISERGGFRQKARSADSGPAQTSRKPQART